MLINLKKTTHIFSSLKTELSLFVNLESPSPKDAVFKVWFKIRLLDFINVLSLFQKYYPVEKGRGP